MSFAMNTRGTRETWRRLAVLVTVLGTHAAVLVMCCPDDFWQGSPRLTIPVTRGLVLVVAFAPDDAALATGDSDGMVRLWEPASGKAIRGWHAHAGFINALSYSADGTTLATGGSDATAALWDTATGQLRVRMKGHPGGVVGLFFAADGGSVTTLTVHHDGAGWVWERRTWDTSTGTETVASVEPHGRPPTVSPDGKTVARHRHGEVHLFAGTTDEFLRAIAGHPDQLNAVAFSRDGRLLASAGNSTAGSCEHPIPWKNGDVRVWDVQSGERLARFHRHWQPVMDVAFSHDDRTLASASYDGTVKLWDVGGLRPQ